MGGSFDLDFPYRDRDQPLTDPAIHDLPDALSDPDAGAAADRVLVRIPAELQAVRSGRKRDWHLVAAERGAPP